MFSTIRNDELDIYRKELNTMLAEKALEGQNSLLEKNILPFPLKQHLM